MKWHNLKNNRCPKCNIDFLKGLTVESNNQPTMFTHKCGFKISEQKYLGITTKLNNENINSDENIHETELC